MTLDDELDVLNSVPFFAGMDPAQLKLLAFASDRIIFKTGQAIFTELDEAYSAFVILSGEANVTQTSKQGTLELGKVQSSSIVGEAALFDDELRTNTVTAASTVDTLLITRDSFQKLMASSPGTMSTILKSLGQRMNKVG